MAGRGKRAGLFGGTFNPVHMGHLRMAEEVRTEFELDQVCFIPAALPPHKEAADLVSAADRCEMIARAIETNPGFFVSDAEIKRRGRSYTIDTVAAFQADQPADAVFYLIIGLDAFFEIETWKSYGALFERIPFVVLQRPGQGPDKTRPLLESMLRHAQRHVDTGYAAAEERRCLVHPSKQSVHLHPATQLDISSTRIRALIKERKSIKYLVPEVVESYILEKELYADIR
jgi:nicotinate-nucleotide adenylyltransferase